MIPHQQHQQLDPFSKQSQQTILNQHQHHHHHQIPLQIKHKKVRKNKSEKNVKKKEEIPAKLKALI